MPATWEPRLAIGVPEIDAQHREIVETAAALEAALATSAEAATLTLEILARYVLVHFETEERWMRSTRYPRLREHVALHDQFIARLVAMTRDHEEGGACSVLLLRLRNALAWLEDHISEDDRRLGMHAAAAVRTGRGAPA